MHPACKTKKVKETDKSHMNNFKRDEWKDKQRKGASLPKSRKRPGGSEWPPETFWLVLVSSLLRGCGFTHELGNLKGSICRSELFPGGSEVKVSACNAGDLGSIPEQEDPLEKEMATHSSILAWRIPWTEEPGGLQSTGSQRVGTGLSSFTHS